MNQKRKDLAFDIFYNRYKVAEKYAYILKVVNSCKDYSQVHITHMWGHQVLHDLFMRIQKDMCDKYGVLSGKGMDLEFYAEKRIFQMQDDLKVQCDRRDNEIFNTPVAPVEEEEEKEEEQSETEVKHGTESDIA